MIPREEFDRLVNYVPDLATKRHGYIIEGLIRWLRPETVLEVGCFRGHITCRAARAIQENGIGRLLTIDNFSYETSPQQVRDALIMCGVVEHAYLFVGTTRDVKLPHVDLAIIDGDHSYEWCKRDAEAALGAGARWLIFHDSFPPYDPDRYITELVSTGAASRIDVEFDSALAVVQLHRARSAPDAQ